MRFRNTLFLTTLALVVAACGGGTADNPTTTTEATRTPDAVRLSYVFEPGTTFEYEVGIDQQIEMSASGDGSAMGDEEIPGNASINLVGKTIFTHTVAKSSAPDTYEITIKGHFTDLRMTGTIDGEPIDQTEVPNFAELEAIDVTIVVDSQGNIILDDDMFGDLLGGDLGGFGDLTSPGMDLGRFVGPPLADREVTVGDTWSETIESLGFMDVDPVVTQIDNEVTGTETIDGFEVFVIETTLTTAMIEFDLGEFLLGFFQAFPLDDLSDEEKAEIESVSDEMRFLFVIDETVTEMTTWFDAEAGYARQAELSMSMSMVVDINMPDNETGEFLAFGMETNMAQRVTYRLIAASDA